MKLFFRLMLISLLLATLNACQKDREVYSCDSAIDGWVKANRAEVVKLSRAELVSYPVGYQRAIFNAMDAEGRLALWQSKLEQVVLSGELSEPELAFVSNVLNTINKSWFDFSDRSEDQAEAQRATVKQWFNTALIDLGWTEDEFYWVLCDLSNVKQQNNTISKSLEPKQPTKARLSDLPTTDDDLASGMACNCDAGSTHPCPLANQDCYRDQNCKETTSGCGALYVFRCDGICKKF